MLQIFTFLDIDVVHATDNDRYNLALVIKFEI